MSLQGKTIIIGVCGGIAAYKAPDLVSGLRKLGAEVHVLLTENAKNFVSALSLEVMSGNKVLSSNWDSSASEPGSIPHIKYAQIADLILVAPATANAIAKMTMGLSDEILFDTILATQAPILVAPAMNTNMWTHPTVRRNLEVMISMGYEIIEPDSGDLACGTHGLGRLAEIETIIKRVKKVVTTQKKPQGKGLSTLADIEEIQAPKSESFFSRVFNKQTKQNSSQIVHQSNSTLIGKKVLITLGATREKIDAVRYITNHSSGKMGLALVREALNRGMQVEVITTIPINEDWVDRVSVISVETHDEMLNALRQRFLAEYTSDPAWALIMVAAVADFKPVYSFDQKIKKDPNNQNLVFELEQTSDILAEIASLKNDLQVAVGFSVETENPIENAHRKVRAKNLDFIVANSPSAFGADDAEVGFVFSSNYQGLIDTEQSFGNISKQVIAINIFDNLEKIARLK
jgi:phosphopantothenoylcysteine decarboxylase / phosphopantothenate---cysteine ligase